MSVSTTGSNEVGTDTAKANPDYYLVLEDTKGYNFFSPLDFEGVLTQNCSPVRNISEYGMEKHETGLLELFLLQELWHSAAQKFYSLVGCVPCSEPHGHLELGHHRWLMGRCRNMSSRVNATNATFV